MELIGKVIGINTSDNIYNLTISQNDGQIVNMKLPISMVEGVQIGHTYIFEYTEQIGVERTAYFISSFDEIIKLPLTERDAILRSFYPSAPLAMKEAIEEVDQYVCKIENEIIKNITKQLIEQNKELFFLYPAASKMHHAYVGGLAYHSVGMLHFADGFIQNYPYLNKDYVYAGILLHDIGKTIELSGAENTEYTLKGQLIGHLVLGAMEIDKIAIKLGYENTEEVMILQHMLISHHGQPQFGSNKKPMTPEALALWYIDTIDSKFRVLGEELAKTENGCFTEGIGVLDRSKIYKCE